ncbi:exopolysaccharide biosynthesis polyprenyl glycosylphosphotransferase [Desulfobulbus sp. F5]|nr:exopolysaccharide biosynthesis polyprenyl glycosylphosphotransferase [Desulfobulbus sp. F5]
MYTVYNYTRKLLVIFDVVFLTLIFEMFFYLRTGLVHSNILQETTFMVISILIVILYIFGSYELLVDEEQMRIIGMHLLSVLISLFIIIIFNYIFYIDRSGLFGRGILNGSFFIFSILSSCYRYFLWRWLKIQSAKKEWCFIVNKENCSVLWRELENKVFGNIIFLLYDTGIKRGDNISFSIPIVNAIDSADFDEKKYDYIVVATHDKLQKSISDKLIESKLSGKKVTDIISFYEYTFKKVPIWFLRDSWFFLSEGFSLFSNRTSLRIKYLSDFILSSILIILSAPIMLIATILIKLDSSGPVFFKQVRTGLDGNDFIIYKFRSMVKDAEKKGVQWAQKKDPRVTRIGKFLRLTRIDELPQLINVFRGEMSFIGPRPERPEFNIQLEKEIPYYQFRHSVKPGITGLAQILYPYGAGVSDAIEKLQYEIFYIKNYSITLDILILLKTIRVVVLGKGR